MTPATAVPEATREEETLRYAASLLSDSLIRDSPAQHVAGPPGTSDPILSSFAQLAALRLNVDRVFISLFDAKRQHVIAEATTATTIEAGRVPRLAPPTCHDDKTAILFSGTAIPRSHSVCEMVLDRPPNVHQGNPALPILMVPDMSLDPRFSSRLYFHPHNTLRFYAGVPIRSPQGIDIGVCCVLNKDPTDGLTGPQQHLLRHISSLSMTHLQSRATAESYRRNERMVRGLGSLIEGTGSMSKWRGGPNPTSFADLKGREGALNAQQQDIQRHGRPEVTYKGPPRNAESGDFAYPVDSPAVTGPQLGEEEPTKGRHSFTAFPENQVEEDLVVMKTLFSRAANIVRESIEVEGALFLDACIGSYGGLVQRQPKESDDNPDFSSSSGNESTHTDDSAESSTLTCGVMGFSNSLTSSINGDSPAPQHATVPETFLARLLRRYPEGHLFHFTEDGVIRWAVTSESESADSAEDLKSLSDDTPPPSDIKSMLPKQARDLSRQQRSRKGDGAVLQKLFPKARSVAVFPLWDSHREKWHATGFAWTMAASRIFTMTGELSYLRAFGSSVMAEVARIDVLRADKAKEDVLGSLSHEIRSPLHGIILGLELMHDTNMDVFQQDVLHTVETCGRTLLDTMDHLLDFSKVNHFLRGPRRSVSASRSRGRGGSPGSKNTIEASMMSLFSDVSLDALLEEVVESIYAGFSFQQSSGEWATRQRGDISSMEQAGSVRRLEAVRHMDTDPSLDAQKLQAGVAIYISIDPTVSWSFHAQPGALRRVVMNIFGNALKYTSRGSVLVSLTQESSPIKRKSRRRSIIFSVSDSGRGISSEFLQNRLFVPFTQENQLASGSGLGLSIVKQIVHGLGGTVGVESKAGYGTTVRVSIPLRVSTVRSTTASISPTRESDFREALKVLKGVNVTLLGFPADFGAHRPLVSDSADSRLCPRLLMETLCRHYLNLNILPEQDDTLTDPAASILICTQQLALQYAVDPDSSEHPVRPIVVICDSILSAHELSSKPNRPTFPIYISQPIGPRKLAKTLTVALQKWEETKAPGSLASNNNMAGAQTLTSDSGPDTCWPSRSRKPSVARRVRASSSSDCSVTPRPAKVSFRNGTTSNGAGAPGDTLEIKRPQPVALQSDPSTPEPPSQPSHHAPSAQEIRPPENANSFLLVDDNAINLKILASYMKKLGRRHDNAMNGLEAFEACRSRQTHYKCIFMDISMPVMDGLEATRHIRAYEKQQGWDPALVIALTGLGSSKTQQEAFASGIDLFLTKPVPLKELGSILTSRRV